MWLFRDSPSFSREDQGLEGGSRAEQVRLRGGDGLLFTKRLHESASMRMRMSMSMSMIPRDLSYFYLL
jgi:hypothetical protein